MYDLLTYIGRFQLLHDGQVSVIRAGLAQARKLLILVGSSNRSPDIRNPFSYPQRHEMLERTLTEMGVLDRVVILPIPDVLYGGGWFQAVERQVNATAQALFPQTPAPRIGIIGHEKDATSYYLNRFPQWGFVPQPLYEAMHSTDLRAQLFTGAPLGAMPSPGPVKAWLANWKGYLEYQRLCEEYAYVQDYQKQWPASKEYHTSDAVVLWQDRILVIRRGRMPGKGFLALPGGFVEEGEDYQAAALRELKEETSVDVSPDQVVGWGYFNDPSRSVRGQIVSHAFLIRLTGDRPAAMAADDAAEVAWPKLAEFLAEPREIFEDHGFIVKTLTDRYREFPEVDGRAAA